MLRLLLFVVLLLSSMATSASAAPQVQARTPEERWILVDSASASLSVMHGDSIEARFEDISLGRSGVKPLHFAGDNTTPGGEYRINGTNVNSRYTLFFHLNYPTVAHAIQALMLGRITTAEFEQIKAAERQGRLPPQNTALGGMIGIHGVGGGNPLVHQEFNWTEGCVALDNQQILALAPLVFEGMRVVIR